MILRRTVFVLGAGASHAYGFPLGAGLIAGVCADLSYSQDYAFGVLKEATGYSDAELIQFRQDLSNSARDSIDAFLNCRTADYDLVGRCAIAQQLLKYEHDSFLTGTQGPDWYGYLLKNILGTSPAGFKGNRLRVITFNFDRSFERRLYIALEANYGMSAALELVQCIPVLHIHGRLGDLFPGSAAHRPYVQATTADAIRSCANSIQVVHNTVHDSILTQARDWLRSADEVYFLGFSYHVLNLEKLGVPDTLKPRDPLVGKTVIGTRLFIPNAQLNSMPSPVRSAISFRDENEDIMVLLRSTAHIYDWE